jgi:heme exporter protein B
MVLYQVSLPPGWPALIGVTVLGTIGFVTLGTFYSAMSSRSRAREVLLPLLLFPMLIPVLLAAVESSASLLGGDPMSEAGAWVRLLGAFDIIFLVASLWPSEYVIEEL